MNRCEKCRLLLPGYFDKKLKKEDKAEIEEHISSCPECADAYAKIKAFADSLTSLPDVKLPASLLSGLSKILEEQGVSHNIGADIKRGLLIHKRQIVHSLAIVSYTIAILLMTAIIIKISFMHDIRNNDGSNGKTLTQSTYIQPPVSLRNPPKQKQDEPGAGGQIRTADTGAYPKPTVSITHAKYGPGNIDHVRFQPIVLDFSMTYEVKQVPKLLDDYIKKSALAANASNENGAILAACIRQTLDDLDRPALPAYMERIKYNKREAWLIVDVWNPDDSDFMLSNSTIFIIDAVSFETLLKK